MNWGGDHQIIYLFLLYASSLEFEHSTEKVSSNKTFNEQMTSYKADLATDGYNNQYHETFYHIWDIFSHSKD